MTGVKERLSSAVHGVLQPKHLKAEWVPISSVSLQRSSHSISVISGRAYLFGGEVNPREPVDNDMHIITLPSTDDASADYQSIPATSSSPNGEVPEKRVGQAAAVIGERIFIFGGRGGKDMKPLEENGRVWIYDTRTDKWSFLDPLSGTPYPAARSYHSAVAIDKPEPPSRKKQVKTIPNLEEPKAGVIAAEAQTDEQMGGYGTFFIHAGCPASGRTNDIWGFDVASRTWKEFPSAPGKPRGGTSIAVARNKIWRYGGFNGESEEGGQIDVLELGVDTFDDNVVVGGSEQEVALIACGSWTTMDFKEKGLEFPGARSVSGFHAVNTGMGNEYLILIMGERDPSNNGHNAAGKFWPDVWAFKIPSERRSYASIKDQTWHLLGHETGQGRWSPVDVADAEGKEGDDVKDLVPRNRGWFASSGLGDLDARGVLLWGGLNEKNEREGDGWILRIK
ncbi:hypothetical protein B7463_g6528, partial [Scytalidium lignicola]